MAPLMHFFATLLFVLIPLEATTHHHHHQQHGLKSLHFTLYQQETLNKTAYFVIQGVAGPPLSLTTAPFGTMFVFQDPLTLKPNHTSKLVGTSEGSAITSGLDGLQSITVGKVTLNLKKHKGSISIVGVTNNIKPSNHPVVGGTGDFLFVQGYITSSPVNLVGSPVTYKIEFHLYWPPYAYLKP
ncbi:putative dirigent protein [Helianthus annuus]|uniref:Dirigent protein n=2 Tax=Helianthus annuus TaxID=4232 RepID=A0A251SHQ5_HELAN|nr:putative dirigent protein [Helianthus annuus]KAJ0464172.1 putative dirigent protein [Helianthus annuus]KAJ0468596.1 putative dirigent protein [Helianthus annuus]KAJ0485744.1 putative dirigent protein [Helianthus annuus]KAJ0656297.1 putative dirigent protein [Helianthus annuus]